MNPLIFSLLFSLGLLSAYPSYSKANNPKISVILSPWVKGCIRFPDRLECESEDDTVPFRADFTLKDIDDNGSYACANRTFEFKAASNSILLSSEVIICRDLAQNYRIEVNFFRQDRSQGIHEFNEVFKMDFKNPEEIKPLLIRGPRLIRNDWEFYPQLRILQATIAP